MSEGAAGCCGPARQRTEKMAGDIVWVRVDQEDGECVRDAGDNDVIIFADIFHLSHQKNTSDYPQGTFGPQDTWFLDVCF